jgi:branched-chain amino acid transport system permease protein
MSASLRRAAFGVAVAGLLLLPFATSGTYVLHVATLALVFSVLAVGLDLVLGYCGQYSFAQGAFFGIGAYASALLALKLGWPFAAALPSAVLIAAASGIIVGLPALRLSGHFLAITTIAFQVVAYILMAQWYGLTGGMHGLTDIPSPGPAALFGTPVGQYYLALAVAAAAVLVAWRMARSRFGREWLAIHGDELLARALGVDSMRRKLLAFAISAALAGAAGSFLAHYLHTIHPAEFSISTSATLLAMTVIGGRGTILGPIVGAVLLTLLPELLRSADEFRLILYGVAMILVVTFFPAGLMGLLPRRA